MREVTYIKYEWANNKLLRESPTENPYAGLHPSEEVTLSSDLPGCDCVSIRRTIKTEFKHVSAVIECLHR